MSKLSDLEAFMRLLHAVQNVERVARIPDETKRRNTAEHTFELAMAAWYIVVTEKLELDLERVLTYALVHDIVEAYAGDSFAYDEAARASKAAREAAAQERIKKEFPQFPDLVDRLDAYEARADAESQFVYALDKLIDPLNTSMETKRSLWKDLGVTYAQIRSYKDSKIATSPIIASYWQAICEKLEADPDFYFHA